MKNFIAILFSFLFIFSANADVFKGSIKGTSEIKQSNDGNSYVIAMEGLSAKELYRLGAELNDEEPYGSNPELVSTLVKIGNWKCKKVVRADGKFPEYDKLNCRTVIFP